VGNAGGEDAGGKVEVVVEVKVEGGEDGIG